MVKFHKVRLLWTASFHKVPPECTCNVSLTRTIGTEPLAHKVWQTPSLTMSPQSVCLWTKYLKKLWTDFHEILYIGCLWAMEEIISFGSRSIREIWPQRTMKGQISSFSQISHKWGELKTPFSLYKYWKSYMGFHLVKWHLTSVQGQRSKCHFR